MKGRRKLLLSTIRGFDITSLYARRAHGHNGKPFPDPELSTEFMRLLLITSKALNKSLTTEGMRTQHLWPSLVITTKVSGSYYQSVTDLQHFFSRNCQVICLTYKSHDALQENKKREDITLSCSELQSNKRTLKIQKKKKKGGRATGLSRILFPTGLPIAGTIDCPLREGCGGNLNDRNQKADHT